MQVWTAEELRAFLAHVADARLRCLWVLAAATAVRRSEPAGLRWKDVDLDQARLVASSPADRGSAHRAH